MTLIFKDVNIFNASLLPDPIPPVIPMINIIYLKLFLKLSINLLEIIELITINRS
jgi:hypothetical protein